MGMRLPSHSEARAALFCFVSGFVSGFVIASYWTVPDVGAWFAGLAVLVSVISLGCGLYTFYRSRIISMKPVLVFTNAMDDKGKARWFLRNVGNGPAINIVVAKRPKDDKWQKHSRVPTLAPGYLFPIDFGGLEIQCDYYDIDNRPYSSRCRDWETTFPKMKIEPLLESSKITRMPGLPTKS